tara:strand:- start:690 stop:914 length:225 start_codon:yes stop_codon:yes gene_type:complete
MKLIPYTDQENRTHYVDITNVMFTESFPIGPPDENGNFESIATRICLATKVGGYVVALETPEVIWERIHTALKE